MQHLEGCLPAEVATRETLHFVRAHLSGGAQHLLEVGCGNGALAAALQADGHTLVALDADAEAVAEARRRGVDARHAAWPDFENAPFDAVLFTRSLHHLHLGMVREKSLRRFVARKHGVEG